MVVTTPITSHHSPSLHAGRSQCQRVFPAPPLQEIVRPAPLYTPAEVSVSVCFPLQREYINKQTKKNKTTKHVLANRRAKAKSKCFPRLARKRNQQFLCASRENEVSIYSALRAKSEVNIFSALRAKNKF